MTIFRVSHNKNYTVINNTICSDHRLSWKAKGIWLYAFSRPDDWQFYLNDLINQSTDGRDSVRSGLEELELFGYLRRQQKRDDQGQYSNSDYTFYETPQPVEIKSTIAENPTSENPPLLNTDIKPSTEEKQQQAAVFFACLEGLDLTNEVKERLCKSSESAVMQAVAWAMHPDVEIKTTLAQAIQWALKEKPEIPIDKEKLSKENRKKALALEGKIASEFSGYHCGPTYIEIYPLSGMGLPTCIEYEDKNFRDRLNTALTKQKFTKIEE